MIAVVAYSGHRGRLNAPILVSLAPWGFASVGRWREAITLVENMRGDGLTPDEYSYAGCIDACAKAMQWKKACQLLDEMRAAGVQVWCFASYYWSICIDSDVTYTLQTLHSCRAGATD